MPDFCARNKPSKGNGNVLVSDKTEAVLGGARKLLDGP